jgi:hypothetical protein
MIPLQNPLTCQHEIDTSMYCKYCHSFILAIYMGHIPNPIHQIACFYRARIARKYVRAYVEEERDSNEQLVALLDNDFYELN